jgi:hypothetical protein
MDGNGQPLNWGWELIGGAQQTDAIQNVGTNSISYVFTAGSVSAAVNYQLQLAPGMGSCRQLGNGDIQLIPNASGKLAIILNNVAGN